MRKMIAIAAASLLTLVSAPLMAAPPADVVVERMGPDQLSIHWSSPDPVDVYVARDARAIPARTALSSAGNRNGQHVVHSAATERAYVILRDTRTGEIARAGERLIPLEAGSNFRDLGGYPAAGGKHVRWGMIYRSGGTPLLTPADIATIRSLGLANMVDLRSDEERVLAPSRIDGVPYTAVGYSMAKLQVSGGMETTYRGLPTMMAPQLRQIFARLLRSEQPLVYNCSAGQDRTGFVTAVVLSTLGTPRDTILADYHLSTRYRRPEFEMPHLDVAAHPGDPVVAMFASFQDNPAARMPRPLKTADGKAFLEFALAEIDTRWGSLDGYLRQELGIKPKDIERLRSLYTE